MMTDEELLKIALIVHEEVEKVIPGLYEKVRARLLKETGLKTIKQIKANKNRPCLGDFVEADPHNAIERSGPKGQTLTEEYNIKFLSFSYPEGKK